MLMRRPIAAVLAGSYFLLIALILVGFAWFSLDSLGKDLESFWRTQVENAWQFQHDHLSSREVNPLDSAQWRDLYRFRRAMGVRITLIAPDGQVIFDTDTAAETMASHADRPEFKAALQGERGDAVRFSRSVGQMMIYRAGWLENPHFRGVLRAAVAVQGLEHIRKRMYRQWLWEGVLALMISFVLALAISYLMVKPIKILQEGAERFSQGRLDLLLPGSAFAEIDSLARSMNAMARALDTQIRNIEMQKAEMASMLASLNEAVVALDQEGRVFRYNQAFLDLFGFRSAEVFGKKLEILVRHTEIHDLLRGDQEDGGRDIEILRGEETLRLQVRRTRLKDMHGMLVVFNDVTRMRKLEEMRRDFVANVSHELKTPITSIKGYVETLMSLDPGSPESRKFLEIVQRHADRLNAIIDDLLTLSRLEQDGQQMEPEFGAIQIEDLVDAAVLDIHSLAAERSIDIRTEVQPNLSVAGNPGLLEQALVNLLSNACKYSPPNRSVFLRAVAVEEQICISVEDQGFGIERRHLSRIFERFYRVDKARSREQGGTGLGLAITKHIVLLHHGRIEVESEVGRGSVFRIYLPRLKNSLTES